MGVRWRRMVLVVRRRRRFEVEGVVCSDAGGTRWGAAHCFFFSCGVLLTGVVVVVGGVGVGSLVEVVHDGTERERGREREEEGG